MVDFLSPGTKAVQRRKGPVVLPGISTAIGGFLCAAQKGPVGKPVLVVSTEDAAEVFGGQVSGSRLADSLNDFFNEGGASCYVVRYIGTGSAVAQRELTTAGGATAGSESSNNNAFPVNLKGFPLGDTFIGKVDGGGALTATIHAHPATLTTAGALFAAGAPGDSVTVQVVVMGIPITSVIDLSAVANTQQAYVDALNAIIGLQVVDSGAGSVTFTTDQMGSGAAGTIVAYGGAAQANIGGPAAGTGFSHVGPDNVANSFQVTETEFAAIMNATFVGSTTTPDTVNHKVTWKSNTTGLTSSVQFTGGTGVAKIAGFDLLLHQGNTTGPVNTMLIQASSPGAWANVEGVQVTLVNTVITTCAVNAAGSTTTLAVTSAARVNVGDQISVTHGGDTERGVVKSISGNVLTLVNPITIPGGGYTTADSVVLETFNIAVFNPDGTLAYPVFMNLRMSPLAGVNYFVAKIAAASRSPIVATDQLAVAPDPRPANDTAPVLMTGGLDGAAPGDLDIIGAPGNSPTGVFGFNKAGDVSFISSPGNTSLAVATALQAYGISRGEVQMFHDPPQGTPPTGSGGVRDYIANVIGFSSSNSCLHWPWVMRLDLQTGVLAPFPPSPFVQGAFARTHAAKNFGQVAAGQTYGQLISALDLESIIEEQSAEYDDFYPVGGNAIISFKDDPDTGGGIYIWGSRTLDTTGEFGQINVQIVFNVAKRQSRTKTRFVNFENNDPDTRANVVRTLSAVYREWRKAGILQGATDADAFFIVCDDTNNTAIVVNSGKMIVRVGLAVERPTEFLEFDFEIDTRAVDKALATQAA